MTRDNPPTPQEAHQETRIELVEAKPRVWNVILTIIAL